MSKIEEIRELCDIRDADNLDLELPTATVRELIALIQNGQSAIDTNKRIVGEISRLKKDNNNLEYALLGVMHSVDKWLDGKELKQDEVNRAATMREKTLKITEELTAELEAYKQQEPRPQSQTTKENPYAR